MTRNTKTLEVIACDRCGNKHEYYADVGQASLAKWSNWHAQGGNPTNIVTIGDGYKFDLCPICTEVLTIFLNS